MLQQSSHLHSLARLFAAETREHCYSGPKPAQVFAPLDSYDTWTNNSHLGVFDTRRSLGQVVALRRFRTEKLRSETIKTSTIGLSALCYKLIRIDRAAVSQHQALICSGSSAARVSAQIAALGWDTVRFWGSAGSRPRTNRSLSPVAAPSATVDVVGKTRKCGHGAWTKQSGRCTKKTSQQLSSVFLLTDGRRTADYWLRVFTRFRLLQANCSTRWQDWQNHSVARNHFTTHCEGKENYRTAGYVTNLSWKNSKSRGCSVNAERLGGPVKTQKIVYFREKVCFFRGKRRATSVTPCLAQAEITASPLQHEYTDSCGRIFEGLALKIPAFASPPLRNGEVRFCAHLRPRFRFPRKQEKSPKAVTTLRAKVLELLALPSKTVSGGRNVKPRH